MKKDILPMKKGAIAFLDILGWKGIWARNNNAIEDLKRILEVAQETLSDLRKGKLQERSEYFSTLQYDVHVLSDTIIVYAFGDANRSIELLASISSSIIRTGLNNRMPIRGAISYGEFEYSDNILVGRAIDEVSSWFGLADSIGVHLTPSASMIVEVAQFEYPSMLVAYDLELKTLGKLSTYCVNWPITLTTSSLLPEWDSSRKKLMGLFADNGPILIDSYKKYENAIAFFDHCARIDYDALFSKRGG